MKAEKQCDVYNSTPLTKAQDLVLSGITRSRGEGGTERSNTALKHLLKKQSSRTQGMMRSHSFFPGPQSTSRFTLEGVKQSIWRMFHTAKQSTILKTEKSSDCMHVHAEPPVFLLNSQNTSSHAFTLCVGDARKTVSLLWEI